MHKIKENPSSKSKKLKTVFLVTLLIVLTILNKVFDGIPLKPSSQQFLIDPPVVLEFVDHVHLDHSAVQSDEQLTGFLVEGETIRTSAFNHQKHPRNLEVSVEHQDPPILLVRHIDLSLIVARHVARSIHQRKGKSNTASGVAVTECPRLTLNL